MKMFFDLPDHPIIRNMEMYGVPDPNEPEVHPICPVCGAEEPEDFYIDGATIIGCSDCIKRVDAFDWAADHMEDESYE